MKQLALFITLVVLLPMFYTNLSALTGDSSISALVGTKWSHTEFGEKCTLEFISKNKVRVTRQNVHYWISEDELKPRVDMLEYYYDSGIDRFVIKMPPFVFKRLLYENGRLIETGSMANVEYERN